MYRMFETHRVRKVSELSSSLWDFCVNQEGSDASRKVFVPSCWETMPGLGNYRGTAVYTRSFTASGNTRLVFKGVSHTAQVYVDRRKVAEHYGAYTPFDVVLKDLEEGEHTLEIVVDNRFSEKSALHIPNDYMTYGGINRPVIMEHLGNAYIKGAHYTPVKSEDRWTLQVEVCVCVLAGNQNISAEVCINGKSYLLDSVTEAKGDTLVFSGCLNVDDVREWSIGEPNLYTVEALLKSGDAVIDDLIDRVGFRDIKIEDNRILLNDKPVRIKGVCRHEDYTGFGCAIPAAAVQRDLQLIRDLGCNSIRTAHYPNDEVFLDLCDEMGILVWEENHARGLAEADMRNPNFEWQCALCNEEMVREHYNHPSIYIWGILNECASETEYGRSCYAKQLNQLRSLDASRPVTFATCRFSHDADGRNLRITDICLDLPDVVSFNMYPRWYFDTDVKQFLNSMHNCIDETAGKGKPMIVSEIGAGGEYGYHSPERLKWSEEYQADALEEQLRAVLSDEQCCGVYVWQYCDVRVSNEWFARRPRTYNNKGLVDGYRRPKLAYETVKRIFNAYANCFD